MRTPINGQRDMFRPATPSFSMKHFDIGQNMHASGDCPRQKAARGFPRAAFCLIQQKS